MTGKPVEIGAAKAASEDDKRTNERSTIAFPYGDLNEALAVADAIHEEAGTECSVDQLAAFLKQSAQSGAFRIKTSTARVFGLIETDKGGVALTALGRQIVDPAHRARAKAQAFLAVPLYRQIFDKYRGHMLPPVAALHREMANMGVAPKQVSKARQAFDRSADQAGFFQHGRDRLVEPTHKGGAHSDPPTKPTHADRSDAGSKGSGGGGGGGGGDIPNLHPFILGLIQTLPPPKSNWPEEDRKKWLGTAESIFSLIYEA